MTKISKRVYEFPLPYEVNGFEIMVAVPQLKNDGLFKKLPKDIQQKFEDEDNMFGSVSITEDMCNRIDDVTWTSLAHLAGLKWHFKK